MSFTRVFHVPKQPKIEATCWERFNKYPELVLLLAILLHFRTGLRPDEILALRERDIKDGYIHIRRQQVKSFEFKYDDGKLVLKGKGVQFVEYPELPTGERCIALTPETEVIINRIIEVYRSYYSKYEDYLFAKSNTPMDVLSFKMTMYDVYELAGVLTIESDLYSITPDKWH